MLDIKKVGVQIHTLRKKIGLSQEKLGEMLNVSPQAISKWENGHTLPETMLLPVLSQIFSCTIDEMIMPAYAFDEEIELRKPTLLEEQAQHIAKYVIQGLENKQINEQVVGLDDNEILNAVTKFNPNLGCGVVEKGKLEKNPRYMCLPITLNAPQKEIRLIEKLYIEEDNELYGYNLFNQYTTSIPLIYYIDIPQKLILMEDLNPKYIQGFNFNENNDFGVVVRENYREIINEAAKLHSVYWENNQVFGRVGLDWRHESEENLLAHICGMEKDFICYKEKEEAGKIPKVWEVFENTIEIEKLQYFQTAILLLKEKYRKLLHTRFRIGKNITVIHGDMHPGNIFISKSSDRSVKFIDFEATRIGLCTEDLAMLVALHIEPDKNHAQPLLDYYYDCLTKTIKDYPYEVFIEDYKISIMENMFFAIRLMNSGIYDFLMRDKAIKAFETFVLCDDAYKH